VAQWLLTRYHNPSKPLASLELLISEPGVTQFVMPGGQAVQVDGATMANVETAVRAWKARGDAHEGNLMLFFFCGHGIASGTQLSLVLEDFGSDRDTPLDHVVDFDGLHLGMDKCKARQQCCFIDVCRVASPTLIQAANYSGRPIIHGSAVHAATPRNAPTYFSALLGTSAYGRQGQPSFFTEALLKAFEGAGADDLEGGWRVQTDMLNLGIHHLLRRAVDETAAAGQVSAVNNLTRFTLHHLRGNPIVPVEVACEPPDRNGEAEFRYQGNGRQDRRAPPRSENWDLELEVGAYQFTAILPERQVAVDDFVRPPFRPVRIRVL